MKKSWKTTLGGILSATGVGLKAAPPSVSQWSDLVTILGTLLMGFAARDNNVSSEDAGAVKK